MRHPYFKEAREFDAKRAAQAAPDGMANASTAPEGSSGQGQIQETVIVQKKKPNEQGAVRTNGDGNPNKPNPNLVKTLPSIGQNSSTTDTAINSDGQGLLVNSQAIHKGNALNTNKHNTIPLFNTGTGTGVSGGTSSLPPIATGNGNSGNNSNNNTGDQSSRSNRSLQQQSAQKKKKNKVSRIIIDHN
jgi:hypothetical protein